MYFSINDLDSRVVAAVADRDFVLAQELQGRLLKVQPPPSFIETIFRFIGRKIITKKITMFAGHILTDILGF